MVPRLRLPQQTDFLLTCMSWRCLRLCDALKIGKIQWLLRTVDDDCHIQFNFSLPSLYLSGKNSHFCPKWVTGIPFRQLHCCNTIGCSKDITHSAGVLATFCAHVVSACISHAPTTGIYPCEITTSYPMVRWWWVLDTHANAEAIIMSSMCPPEPGKSQSGGETEDRGGAFESWVVVRARMGKLIHCL